MEEEMGWYIEIYKKRTATHLVPEASKTLVERGLKRNQPTDLTEEILFSN